MHINNLNGLEEFKIKFIVPDEYLTAVESITLSIPKNDIVGGKIVGTEARGWISKESPSLKDFLNKEINVEKYMLNDKKGSMKITVKLNRKVTGPVFKMHIVSKMSC